MLRSLRHIIALYAVLLAGGGVSPSAMAAPSPDVPFSPAVCAQASKAETLPDDLKYTSGFIDGKSGTVFTRYETGLKAQAYPESLDYLTRLNQALAAQNVRLLFLLLPPRAVVLGRIYLEQDGFDPVKLEANYRARTAQLRTAGMLVPDVLTPLQQDPDPLTLFFRRDTHWTPKGAEMVAQAIARDLSPLLDQQAVERHEFQTQITGQTGFYGLYAFPLNKVCQTPLLEELREDHRTQDMAPASGLLDEVLPPVVLVGTSFSNRAQKDEYNFSGALR